MNLNKIDVVTTCILRDLPLLEIGYRNMVKYLPVKKLHVITRRDDFRAFKQKLGGEIVLYDECHMIETMTPKNIKKIPLAKLSQGHGWYFQQLLKFQFSFINKEDDYYLVWDADTVPLKKMEFFDYNNKMLLTKASEYHRPYFQTYEQILGKEAQRDFSFIAQHMIIQKSVLREMLSAIESHCPGINNWAWKIMENLQGEGSNKFSEFETYGHYIKDQYPDRVAFRELPWLRHGARECGRYPSNNDLATLSESYYFASFEKSDSFYRRMGRKIRNKIRKYIRSV